MYKTSSGKSLNLSSAKEIASGGEGKIYEHPSDKNKVVKIYHQPRKPEFEKHLKALSKIKGGFVSPIDVYLNNKGEVAGFDMKYVNLNDYWLFNNLFNKGFCNSNGIDDSFKVNVLESLAGCLHALHDADIVVGDLNMYNIFFNKKCEVLFVDVDSYQTKTQPHSGVLLDDIRDWTTASINTQTDYWAYDILAFWATTYCHPFKWVVPGNKESLEQRVKTHKSYLSSIPGMKIPALYQPPKGEIEKQFRDIFGGRRYMINFKGIYVPVSQVVKQAVTSAKLNVREILKDVSHVNASKNSIAVRNIKDGTWVMIDTSIASQIRLDKVMAAEQLYPAGNQYARFYNGMLEFSNGKQYTYGQPQFYYNDGSLVVFDYAKDQQWNINLANQQFGVDSTSNVVFTKSILVRGVPIQNFGGSTYLNIPNGNKYALVKMPKGLKDAYYADGFVATETKVRSRVEYALYNPLNLADGVDLDYLPHFCAKGDTIFVPENGHIAVYKGGTEILQLDLSICTRDSRLYMTTSGILMLENNTLYLLNTR